ncbi:hypothetical protein GCM10019016_120990 [Streptomyces prasinosporus]|uniref:site-specific DNA-methyltransferase (adenine-specific) n=1 Tax=Streptomyces prasinosporus TaxID=68256 RepID=A0ABP6UFK8_9ACTN
MGKGFLLSPEQAEDLLQRNPRNKDVLFPYLNGEDLNSRPDCSASRWVINFHDWPEERAREYSEVFAIVERNVKPERLKVKHSKNAREKWWLYERSRPELYSKISGLDRVLVVALVSRTVMPVSVPTGQVFSHMLGVFAASDPAYLALLNSNIHYSWAITRGSSLKGDLRYTPSDIYETLPLPTCSSAMATAGINLDQVRRSIMLRRGVGLTTLYRLVHDLNVIDSDIQDLRAVHVEIDRAVLRAYEWHDLNVHHDFVATRQGTRFSLPQSVRTEVIDRLLELNHAQRAGGGESMLF